MKFKVGTVEYEIDDAKLAKSLEDKETVLTLVEDVIVRTTEEETKFVEKRKSEARKEGVEIAVKKIREEKGLTFEGKTIENLLEASNAKALEEANLNPDEQVKKLNTKLSEKNTALTTATKRAEEAENRLKQTQSELKINKLVEGAIPKDTLLPAEDIMTILKSKLEFKENEEGVVEVYQNGKVLQNASADALPVKEAIENFFRDNTHYVKPVSGGAGGGDSSGKDGKITLEKFNENLKSEGIEINSKDYDAKLQDAIKAGTISDLAE